MIRDSVASTNVASIGYDEASQTLEVEFMNGAIYQYYNVPAAVYEQIMQSQSKGAYLNTYVKNNYAYSRVG
jgi:hypothetical protein